MELLIWLFGEHIWLFLVGPELEARTKIEKSLNKPWLFWVYCNRGSSLASQVGCWRDCGQSSIVIYCLAIDCIFCPSVPPLVILSLVKVWPIQGMIEIHIFTTQQLFSFSRVNCIVRSSWFFVVESLWWSVIKEWLHRSIRDPGWNSPDEHFDHYDKKQNNTPCKMLRNRNSNFST